MTTLASAFEGRLEQQKQRKVSSSKATTGCGNVNCARWIDLLTPSPKRRGVDALTAAVPAETAVGVVEVALRCWIESDGQESLLGIVTGCRRGSTRPSTKFHQRSQPPSVGDPLRF